MSGARECPRQPKIPVPAGSDALSAVSWSLAPLRWPVRSRPATISMIGVTVFGLFLTPVFYVLLRSLTGMKPLTQHGEATIPGKAHAA